MTSIYYDTPKVARRNTDSRVVWSCPREGCFGVMFYIGEDLLIGGGAYVHKCDVCAQTLAIKGVRFSDEYREDTDSNR